MATPPLDGRVVHGVLLYLLDTTSINLASPLDPTLQDNFPFPFGRDYLNDPTHLKSSFVARYPPEQSKPKRKLAARDPSAIDPETGQFYVEDLLTDLVQESLTPLIYPAGIKLSRTQLPTTCHSFILAGVKEMNSSDPIESTKKRPSHGFCITQWVHIPKQLFESIKLQCSYQFFNEVPLLPGELPEPPSALFAPRSMIVMASSNHFSAIFECLLRLSKDCLFDIDLCQYIYHVFDHIPTTIDRGPSTSAFKYLLQRKAQAKRKHVLQRKKQRQDNKHTTTPASSSQSSQHRIPGTLTLNQDSATDFLNQQYLLERGRRAIIRQPRIRHQILHDPNAILAPDLLKDLIPPLVVFNSINSPISGPSIHLSSVSHSHLHLMTSEYQASLTAQSTSSNPTSSSSLQQQQQQQDKDQDQEQSSNMSLTLTPPSSSSKIPPIAIVPATPLPCSLLVNSLHLHTSISSPRPLILTPLKGLPFYAPSPHEIAQTFPSFVFPQYPYNSAPLVDPHQFYLLLRTLSPSIIIHIITAILSQMSVLCVSDDISLLTPCLQAILSLIYPFEYTTSYIPILSTSLSPLLDNLQAFLYGAHTSMIEIDISDVTTNFFIVDFNKNSIVFRHESGDIFPMPPPVPKLSGAVANLARRVIHLFKFDSHSEFSELSIHKARMKRFHQLPIAYFNRLIKQWNDSLTQQQPPPLSSDTSLSTRQDLSQTSQSSFELNKSQQCNCNPHQHTRYGYQYSSNHFSGHGQTVKQTIGVNGESLSQLLTSFHHKSQTICPIHGLQSILQMKAELTRSLTIESITTNHSHSHDHHLAMSNILENEFGDLYSPTQSALSPTLLLNQPQSQLNPTGLSPYHIAATLSSPHQASTSGCIPIYQASHDVSCPAQQLCSATSQPSVPTQHHYELLPELLDLSSPSLLLLAASPQIQLQQMCLSCQHRVLTYRPNKNNIPLSLTALPPRDQHLLLPAFSTGGPTYDSLMEQFQRGNLLADDIIQYNLSRLKLDSPWSSLGEIGHNRVGCCISSAHASVCPIGFETILPRYTNPNSLDLGRYGLSMSAEHPSHPSLSATTSTKSNSIMAMLSGGGHSSSLAALEIDSIHDTTPPIPFFSLDDFEIKLDDHESTPMFSSIQQAIFQLQRLRYQQRHFNRGVWGSNAFNSSLITELVVPRINFLPTGQDVKDSLEGFLNDEQSVKQTILRPAPSYAPSYSNLPEDSHLYPQQSTTRSNLDRGRDRRDDDYDDGEASTQQVLTRQPHVFEVGDPSVKNNYTIPELHRLPWRIALRMYLALLLSAIQIRSSLKMAFPFHEEQLQTGSPIDGGDFVSTKTILPNGTRSPRDPATETPSSPCPLSVVSSESDTQQFRKFHLNRQRISSQGLHVHPATSELGIDYESYFLFYPTISTAILNSRLPNPIDASFAKQRAKSTKSTNDHLDLFTMLRSAPSDNNNVRFQDFEKANRGCSIFSLPFPDFTVYNNQGQAQSIWLQRVKVIYLAFNTSTQTLADLTFGQVELPEIPPGPSPDDAAMLSMSLSKPDADANHKGCPMQKSPNPKRPFLRRVFGRRPADIETKTNMNVLLDQLPVNTVPALIIDHEHTLLQYCCRLIDYSRQLRISRHMKDSVDQIDTDFFSQDGGPPSFSYQLHISNSRRSFTTPTFHPVAFYLYSNITPVFVTPAPFFNELLLLESRYQSPPSSLPTFPEDEDCSATAELIHIDHGSPLVSAMSPQQFEFSNLLTRQRSSTLTSDPEDDGFHGDTVFKYPPYKPSPLTNHRETDQTLFALPVSGGPEDISFSFDPELSILSGNSVFSQSMLSLQSIQSTLNTSDNSDSAAPNSVSSQNPLQVLGERLYNTTKLSEFEAYVLSTMPVPADQVLLTKGAIDALHSGSEDSTCNFDDITRAYYGNTDSMTDSQEENQLSIMASQYSHHADPVYGTTINGGDSSVVTGDCDFDLPSLPKPSHNKALHRANNNNNNNNNQVQFTTSSSSTLRNHRYSVLDPLPQESTPLPFSQYPRLWKVSPHSMSATPIRSFRSSILSSFVSLYQGYWLSFTRPQKQRPNQFDSQKKKNNNAAAAAAAAAAEDASTQPDSNLPPDASITIELKKISPHEHNCNTAELLHNTHDDLFRSFLGLFTDQNQTFSHFCSKRQGTLASSESIRTWRRQWTIIRKLARDRQRFKSITNAIASQSIVSKVYTASLPHPITYTNPCNQSSGPVIASELFDTLDLTPNVRNRCCFNIDCDCQFIPATSFNSPYAGMIGFTQSSELIENISRPILDPMTSTCKVPAGTSSIFTGLLNRIRSQPLFRGVRVPDWFDLQCLLKQQTYSVQLELLGKKSFLSLLHLKSPSSFITSWSQYLFEISTTPKGSQLSYYTSTQQFNETESSYRTAVRHLQNIGKRLESGSALTRSELLELSAAKGELIATISSLREHRQKLRDTHRIGSVMLYEGNTVISIPDSSRLPSRAPSPYCFELTIGLDETSLKHLLPLLNQPQLNTASVSPPEPAPKSPTPFLFGSSSSPPTAKAYFNPLSQSLQRLNYNLDSVKRFQQNLLHRDRTNFQSIQSIIDQLQIINSYISSRNATIGWIFDNDLVAFGPKQLHDLYELFYIRLKQIDVSSKALNPRTMAQSASPVYNPLYNLVADINQFSYHQSSAFGSTLSSISSPHPPLFNDTSEFTDVIQEHSYCPNIPIQYTHQILQNASTTQITLVSKQAEQQGWLLVKTQQVTSASVSQNINQTKRLNMNKYAILQELSDRQVHAMAHGLLLPSVHIHNPLSSLLLTPRTMSSSITTLRSVQRQIHYSFFTTTGYQHDYLQPLHAKYLKTPSDFRCRNVIPINRHDESFRQQANGKQCCEVVLDIRQKAEYTDIDASTMFFMTLPLHAAMLNPLTPLIVASQSSMQILAPYLSLPTYLPESLQEALQSTSSKDKDDAQSSNSYLFINQQGNVSLTPNPQVDPKQNKSSGFKIGKSSAPNTNPQDTTFFRVYPANKKAGMGLFGISQGEIDVLNMHGVLMDPLTLSEFLSHPPPTLETLYNPSPYLVQPPPFVDMTAPPQKPSRFADIPAAVRGLRSILWPMTGCLNILSDEQAKSQPAFASRSTNNNISSNSLDSVDPPNSYLTNSPSVSVSRENSSNLPSHERRSTSCELNLTDCTWDSYLPPSERSQQRPSYIPKQLHHTQRYLTAKRLISSSPEILMGLYNACEKAFDSLIVMGAINGDSLEMDHQNAFSMCQQFEAHNSSNVINSIPNLSDHFPLSQPHVLQHKSDLGIATLPIISSSELTQTRSSIDALESQLSFIASDIAPSFTASRPQNIQSQSGPQFDTLTLLVHIHDQHRSRLPTFAAASMNGTTLCSRASIFSTITLSGATMPEHTPPTISSPSNSNNTFTYPAPHPVSPSPPEKCTASFTFCASDSKTRNIWIKALAARTVVHTHDYISVAQTSFNTADFDFMDQPIQDAIPAKSFNLESTAGQPHSAPTAGQFVLASSTIGQKYDVSTAYAVLLALLHLGKAIDRVDNLWFVTSFAAVLLRSKAFNRIDLIDWCLHHSGTSPAAAILAQILTAPPIYKISHSSYQTPLSIYDSPIYLSAYPYLLQDLLPLCLTPRTTFSPLANSLDQSALTNNGSSFTKMRILFATIRQFTLEDDTHTVQSFLGAIKNQIVASVIKCLHHTDPIVDVFAYLLHPEMDDSNLDADHSFSSCICGCCKDTSYNGSAPLIVYFPIVYRAICAALFEFIGILHTFVSSFVNQHFNNIQQLQVQPSKFCRATYSSVATNTQDGIDDEEDNFGPEQKFSQITFTPHDFYRYMMTLLVYSTPLSPQIGPHNAYLSYLEESIIATKQVMRSYTLLNAKSRYSVYKITNQDFALYLISTGRYDAATACRLVIIAADLGIIYNSATASDVRIVSPQVQVKSKQHIVSVYRGFESFHDQPTQDFKSSPQLQEQLSVDPLAQSSNGLGSSLSPFSTRDSNASSAPSSPGVENPFLPFSTSSSTPKSTQTQSPLQNSSSVQSNSKKYCTMLAANTYFICSPRHNTHYTRGVISVSNTTEYLKHQSFESFCMNVSYLNAMCFSHFSIPIFKSFWVSSPLFDSPFTCPPAYINRYNQPIDPKKQGSNPSITMQVNNHLFHENQYPLPVIVPQNLSQISTPSPTSSKLSLQFSSSNNYYFNHSSHQTCICKSILEPTSVDLSVLYILRSTFNTIHTEKIKHLYQNSLHSFAISFNGQQALTALLQQHAIATSEKEAIGLLTRLLHLNLIANLDYVESHFSNQKKMHRLECDHVKPLPSFNPSANYVISLQLQDQ